LYDACSEAGFTVPDEIAILGAGNDETLCESVAVPLSSVELDVEEMAFRAAAALAGLMRGETVADLVRVPPKGVITRISTDIRAVSNPQVAQALNYIAEHFPEPGLSVAEIAEAIGVSRRHLERSFRTETGSTVHEHIVKRRMQEASRLLRTHPRAKIAAVAQLVGLDGAGSFFRTFRRFFGESPRLHRQGGSRDVEAPAEAEAEEVARESA
jgi:LacI family transcriptional regulator